MKRAISVMCLGVACLLGAFVDGCELGPFTCEGTIPGQGPRCYCDADGLLCGHDGFAPCTECPSP